MKSIKGISIILILSIMCTIIIGCNNGKVKDNNTSIEQESNKDITFKDDLGYDVTVKAPKKVAVASESLTDAYMLAGGEVAATTEDTFSSEKVKLKDGVVNIGTVKNPSIEKIIDSGADFVILSGAISSEVKLRDQLVQAGIPTAYFNIEYFEDYENMMSIFNKITGRDDLYKKNVEDVKAEVEEQKKLAENPGPSVLLLRAYSTGVTAKGSDSMVGAMLKELGCINVADDKNSFGELSMEAVINADPDYIFVTTMGQSDDAAIASLDKMFTSNKAWNDLKAIKNNHYYILDKKLFHNKPNERWGESYEILAEILYPEK